MAKIILPRRIDCIEEMKRWEEIWDSAEDASYSLPKDMTENEIRHYFSLFLPRLPNSFASAILSDLAENELTPWELLPELYEKGDSGCKVSICLRSDIPNGWLEKCLNSPDMWVLEHVVFNKRVSVRECKELLQKPLEKCVKDTIIRAIEHKESSDG